MEKIANSWWMYLLGAIVVLFVLAGSLFFIFKSYKDAKKLNMDTAILKKTIINSAIFTILPSISILIGVITLSGLLGIPLPWIRLTVIGALHYEGVAANAAYEGIKSISELTEVQFVTIAFVMTLGILSGPLYCLFGFKSYEKKVLSKATQENVDEVNDNEILNNDHNDIENNSDNNNEKKKKSFGDVLFNAVFIAMICSFLATDIVKVFPKKDEASNFVPLCVILVTFSSMFIFDLLQKKLNWKWLSSFDLGLSMLIGMTVAVFIG